MVSRFRLRRYVASVDLEERPIIADLIAELAMRRPSWCDGSRQGFPPFGPAAVCTAGNPDLQPPAVLPSLKHTG
jgi:hypothetical protein